MRRFCVGEDVTILLFGLFQNHVGYCKDSEFRIGFGTNQKLKSFAIPPIKSGLWPGVILIFDSFKKHGENCSFLTMGECELELEFQLVRWEMPELDMADAESHADNYF